MAGRSKKKPLSRRQGLARYLRELEVVDYRLIISIVFLCVFGLIMIYSASAAESGVSLVLKQFGIGAGGFVLMWIVSYWGCSVHVSGQGAGTWCDQKWCQPMD